jgi:hypothetical protein
MMMRQVLYVAAAVAVAACTPSAAQQRPGAPQPGARAQQAQPPAAPRVDRFTELTRGAAAHRGFYTLYTTEDKLFLAIPKDRLGQDFLFEAKVAQGVGARGLYGGTMLNLFEGDVMAFEHRGDRIFLVKKPHRFRAADGTPQAAAVELSFTPSIIESAKVEATKGDTLLINIYDWVVGDLAGISDRLRGVAAGPTGQPGTVTFDRGRSYLDGVKAFPKNVNLRSTLTFRPAQPINVNAIADNRYITLGMHYTFAELPEVPMEPRLADDRMGFFMTVHKDFSSDESTHFVRFVNRWRLEKGEPAGNGLYHPKTPITYYLDHTIPIEYRPFFMEGILAWNRAFEAAGWKDAVRAEMLPDGADAEDIRYATLRWNTSDQTGYSAIGPSTVDPRTGEILDADMLYEANMVLGFRNGWRNLVSPQQALELALGITEQEDPENAFASHLHFGDLFAAQGALLRAALAERGELGPGDPVPMEYVGEAIRWVVMHEVGHTLGMQHNFRSSTETPLDRLHDREWVRQHGLVASVMDYHAPNVAPRGQPQGYFYTPGVGTADDWKIAFAYTADPERAALLARQAARQGHAFGSDADASGPGAMDPSVNVYDLSADPLAWSRQRVEVISGLWKDLPGHVLADNSRYADVTDAFRTLMGQYGQALAPAVKYVGGQYVHRTRVGDEHDQGPFVPIERARQREALAHITASAFSERAFQISPAVFRQFGPNRWGHWGQTTTFGGRIDYPLHEEVLGLQRSLLTQLTSPLRLARIRDAELKFGTASVLTIPELFEQIGRDVWSEVYGPARNIPAMRRDLQRAHLDRLIELTLRPQAQMPADARAIARMQLVELDRRLGARTAAAGGLDAYTRAHLEEAKSRIGKALEAELQ